jgi:hypothetical protein
MWTPRKQEKKGLEINERHQNEEPPPPHTHTHTHAHTHARPPAHTHTTHTHTHTHTHNTHTHTTHTHTHTHTHTLHTHTHYTHTHTHTHTHRCTRHVARFVLHQRCVSDGCSCSAHARPSLDQDNIVTRMCVVQQHLRTKHTKHTRFCFDTQQITRSSSSQQVKHRVCLIMMLYE